MRGHLRGTADHRPLPLVGRETPNPRWAQSFSEDGGETWEKNFENVFTRTGDDELTRDVGAVRADYVHIPKFATPAPLFDARGVVLKWYDIAPVGCPVPEEIHELARAGMHDGVVSGQLALEGDLGFVILHRCGESFYFLLDHDLEERERAVGDGVGEGRPGRPGVQPVAGLGDSSPGVLRLGARSGVPRAARVERVPALGARPGGPPDLPRRRLRRDRMT